MDDLERQMEHLRSRMQRTLSGAEGSGRRTALERLRNGFAGRVAARNTGASGKDAPEPAEPRPSEATQPLFGYLERPIKALCLLGEPHCLPKLGAPSITD
jgi:hypothetical protein